MRITIVAVGKMKERYLLEGMAEYLKRLRTYAKVEIIEVADDKAPERLSVAEMEQVKNREGERILARIPVDAHVVALAIEGKMHTSEAFAEMLDSWATYGKSKIVFVIGGSLGLGAVVLQRADELLSFSKLTFPHQMMRLILVEQVYRGFRIVRGESYHK